MRRPACTPQETKKTALHPSTYSALLQAWLAGEGQGVLPLNEAARVDCLYGIARALEFLHSQGFVHGGCAVLHCAALRP